MFDPNNFKKEVKTWIKDNPEATAAVSFAESLEQAGPPVDVQPPPVPRGARPATQPPPLPPEFRLPTEQQA